MKFIYFLIFTLLLTPAYAQEKYVLGEGYQIAELPVYIGGYFSLDYQNKDKIERYRVDDIAFLSYGGNNTLSYLVELEFKEYYVNTDGESTNDHKLYIERLYFDYTLNDNAQVRLGKFNSPVGYWNLMPINVLRETSSSPILTDIIYPEFTTGANLSYESFDEYEFRVDATLQNNATIDDDYNNYDVKKHFALGVTYESGDYSFKANGGYFQKKENIYNINDFFYAQLSTKIEKDKYQILAEVATQQSKDKDTNHAAYVQGVYRFTPKHIGILRLESFKDDLAGVHDDIAIIGYTYRPLYPIALKSEYQQHSLKDENQVIFSFSVLF